MIRLRRLFGREPATARKVLVTQRALKRYGGSEMFAIEVARGLKALGHDVALYCPDPGKLTNIVTPSGIPVCRTPDAVPFVPDIVHGQHHLPTLAALAWFPTAAAVYCWHGARPWVEKPPRHPRIRYYMVTSERMKPRLSLDAGVPEDRIVTIPNFVDTARFSRVRRLDKTPSRAVIYGLSGFNTAELAQLESACDANGLTLDKVGYAFGNPRPRPEYFLPDYDVAFAIGRCALEALASGCAVMPIVPQLAGSLITPYNFASWSASNYSPRYYTSAEVMNAEWLARQIRDIDPAAQAEVTRHVRAHHGIDGAMKAIDALHGTALEAGPPDGSAPEFADYLAALAHDADDIWGALEWHKIEEPRTAARIAELEARNEALVHRMLQGRDS